MREDAPAEPVDDRHQVDEAARHRDVGDVRRPGLIGPPDLHAAQEVGVNPVTLGRLRRVWPAIDRLDPHTLHQRPDVTRADRNAFAEEHVARHPGTRERVFQMQLADPALKRPIPRRNRPRLGIDAAPADVQSLRLPDGRRTVRVADHRLALRKSTLPGAPSKKSFSSAGSPILACNAFQSARGELAPPLSCPKTPDAPSRSWLFHCAS